MLTGITIVMMVVMLVGSMGIIKLTAVFGPSSYYLFIALFLVVALIGFHIWSRYRSNVTAQQVADLMKEALTTPLEKSLAGDSPSPSGKMAR